MRKSRVATKNGSIFDVVFEELIRLETKRKRILTVIENMTLSTCSQTRKRNHNVDDEFGLLTRYRHFSAFKVTSDNLMEHQNHTSIVNDFRSLSLICFISPYIELYF